MPAIFVMPGALMAGAGRNFRARQVRRQVDRTTSSYIVLVSDAPSIPCMALRNMRFFSLSALSDESCYNPPDRTSSFSNRRITSNAIE